MIRARERAKPQMRLVPMHTPMLVIRCWGRYWQGRETLQIRTILSSTWRVRVRCIVDGSGACAPPLTVVAVCTHRRAASASAHVHRRVVPRSNADGSPVINLAFCWRDESVSGLQQQVCICCLRWLSMPKRVCGISPSTSHQGRHFRSQTAGNSATRQR